MTQEQLYTMTPEAKRVAIAQACGWKRERMTGRNHMIVAWRNPDPDAPFDWEAEGDEALPDYLNSLDAMAKAESSLIFSKRQRYYDALRKVRAGNDGYLADIELCLSTATQRADAFLLAIG